MASQNGGEGSSSPQQVEGEVLPTEAIPVPTATLAGTIPAAEAIPTEAFAAVGNGLAAAEAEAAESSAPFIFGKNEGKEEHTGNDGDDDDHDDESAPRDPISKWGTVQEQEARIATMQRNQATATAEENFQLAEQIKTAIATAKKRLEYTLAAIAAAEANDD